MALPRLVLVVCFLAVVAAACGKSGGSTPSSPTAATPVTTTSAPTTTTTTTVAPTVGPYTFNFSDTTSAADQALIRDNVNFAHDFFQTTFGRTMQNATTISTSTTAAGCSQGGSAAFTGLGAVTFCVANPGWTQLGAMNHQKIVIHELYHVLQFERRWLGQAQAITGPDWLIEGSAEVVGFLGMAQKGWVSTDTARGCWTKEMSDFASRQPPGLPALNLLESHQQFQTTPGPSYTVSSLAVDRLINNAGVRSLNSFMDAAGSQTQAATSFNSAFGLPVNTFYDQFAAYRAGLSVPPAYLCGG